MSLRLLLVPTLALAVVLATGCGSDSDKAEPNEPVAAEWTYSGESGPGHWGDLDDEYELCEEGQQQSPINLTDARRAPFPRITTDYVPEHLEVEDNGHAVEVLVKDPRSSITIDGNEYRLEQFHVHMPSEEAIDGRHFAASIHLVHISEQNQIAVIAVLARPGAANPAFDFDVPSEVEATNEPEDTIDPDALLPESKLAYRYQGSLTTPPCSEGVVWTVFKQPITLSPAQLDQISEAHDGNNRPIQPRNQRQILFGPALTS